jgi:hypothetical protein
LLAGSIAANNASLRIEYDYQSAGGLQNSSNEITLFGEQGPEAMLIVVGFFQTGRSYSAVIVQIARYSHTKDFFSLYRRVRDGLL